MIMKHLRVMTDIINYLAVNTIHRAMRFKIFYEIKIEYC